MQVWERISLRAHKLSADYPESKRVLNFISDLAEYQGKLYEKFSVLDGIKMHTLKERPPVNLLAEEFNSYVLAIIKIAPALMKSWAYKIKNSTSSEHMTFIISYWEGKFSSHIGSNPQLRFLAKSFLQPYAVLLRERGQGVQPAKVSTFCGDCSHKPSAGIVRSGKRLLCCSLCLAEWNYDGLCVSCRQNKKEKLVEVPDPKLDYLTFYKCFTCNKYLKFFDLDKNPDAVVSADEIIKTPAVSSLEQDGFYPFEMNISEAMNKPQF